MKAKKRNKIILWILIFAWMAVIFLFSSQNGEESSQLSEGFLREFILCFLPEGMNADTVDLLEYIVRKIAHMTEYAVLGILISLQIRMYEVFRSEAGKILAAGGLVLAYAATDEFHQLFIGGRSGQLTDILIDACGGVIGAVIVHVLAGYSMKKQKTA